MRQNSVIEEPLMATGGRPMLDARDQRFAVVFGLWMVVGLFIDGWAHDNNRPESFFTPWHGILYSGFGAASFSAIWSVRRHRPTGASYREAIPQGHGLTIAALGFFSLGAIGDLVWHELLGIEVGIEALLSPTHLVLLVAGLVVLSSPFRSAWSSMSQPQRLSDFLAPLLSLTLSIALIGFFSVYLSPFVNRAAASGFRRRPGPHAHPATDPAELLQLLGLASILFTTLLITCGIQLVIRRWSPPPGTFVFMLGIVVLLFVGLDEFAEPALLLCGITAGLVTDAAKGRVPAWALGIPAALALWLTYFGLSALGGSVAWTAELWTGSIVLSTLLAGGVGLVALSPPLSGALPEAP